MEIDQTKVVIKWGNCEKMADVLTEGVDLSRKQENVRKGMLIMRIT